MFWNHQKIDQLRIAKLEKQLLLQELEHLTRKCRERGLSDWEQRRLVHIPYELSDLSKRVVAGAPKNKPLASVPGKALRSTSEYQEIH